MARVYYTVMMMIGVLGRVDRWGHFAPIATPLTPDTSQYVEDNNFIDRTEAQ